MFCWNVLWSTVLTAAVSPVAAFAAANRSAKAFFGTGSEPLDPMVTVPVAAPGLPPDPPLLLLLEHAERAGIPRALTPARPTAPRNRERRETPRAYGEFCAEDMELLLWSAAFQFCFAHVPT